MHNFKELNVWKLSRALVKEIYEVTSEIQKNDPWLNQDVRQESYI